jgi:hypothetical protein
MGHLEGTRLVTRRLRSIRYRFGVRLELHTPGRTFPPHPNFLSIRQSLRCDGNLSFATNRPQATRESNPVGFTRTPLPAATLQNYARFTAQGMLIRPDGPGFRPSHPARSSSLRRLPGPTNSRSPRKVLCQKEAKMASKKIEKKTGLRVRPPERGSTRSPVRVSPPKELQQ